jgi:hypothetical protein
MLQVLEITYAYAWRCDCVSANCADAMPCLDIVDEIPLTKEPLSGR